jgi:hypothetical protein
MAMLCVLGGCGISWGAWDSITNGVLVGLDWMCTQSWIRAMFRHWPARRPSVNAKLRWSNYLIDGHTQQLRFHTPNSTSLSLSLSLPTTTPQPYHPPSLATTTTSPSTHPPHHSAPPASAPRLASLLLPRVPLVFAPVLAGAVPCSVRRVVGVRFHE